MSWLIDGRTFAKKVKNPSYNTRIDNHAARGIHTECPSCGHGFEESEVWPGFPLGVKFDPSDQEILKHLAAQVGIGLAKPHPFITEFIPTIDVEGGICYTHPEKLPGVRRDGSSAHFFHIPPKAYMTGSRKRRKVHTNEGDELRWHKTGKTRPVIEDGNQLGCKKIMVLYVSCGKQGKPEKTNWVMHQYHLGVDEEEREGELVVSKVLFQTQPRQSSKENDDDFLEETEFQLREKWRNSEDFDQTQVDTVQGCRNDLLGIPTTTSPEIESTEKSNNAAFGRPMRSGIFDISHESKVSEYVSSPEVKALESASPDEGDKKRSHAQTRRVLGETKNEDKIAVKSSQEECLLGSDSQLLSGSLDAELLKLLCNENLKALGAGDAVNGLKSIVAEANSSQDRPSLDKIFLGTPPELLESLMMNSQGTSSQDWFEKLRLFGDSQRIDDFNLSEFFQNSQSQQ